jgi:hypothetical protein
LEEKRLIFRGFGKILGKFGSWEMGNAKNVVKYKLGIGKKNSLKF